MARTEPEKFEVELGKLMEKHQVYPAVIIYHPGGTEPNRMEVTEYGHASTEWMAQAGEAFFLHAEHKIINGRTVSAIEKFPEEVKSKKEEHWTPSGLMQKIMKGRN